MSENNNIEVNGQYKFDNCRHRSSEMQKTLIKRCQCQGGDYEDTGFYCSARKIFKVDPSICEYCYMFEKK